MSDKLKLTVLLSAIDKVTGPLKRISAGGKRTADALRSAKTALRGLQQQGRQAGKQQAQIKALQDLGRASANARGKVKTLQAQLLNAGGGTKRMKGQLDAARRSVERLGRKESDLRGKVKATGDALRAAGYDAKSHGAAMLAAEGKVAKLAKRLGRQAGFKRFRRGLNDTAGNLGRATAAMSIYGGAVVAPLAGIVRTAAAFERYQTILETVEGSSAKAKESMRWVSDFAAKTPSDLAEVMDAFVQMRSYGIDPTDGSLRILGDTAAAMGKDLNQAVEAISDAMTGEFERLKTFGIKARAIKGTTQTIFDYTDKAGKQMSATVDRNNRAIVQSTLQAIWNEKYGGAMDKMSSTWDGMVSNVGDQWTRFKLLIADDKVFKGLKGKLADFLKTINAMAEDGRLEAKAEVVSKALVGFINGTGKVVAAAKVLGSAFSLIANAFTLIGKGIGTFFAALTLGFEGWQNIFKSLPEKFEQLKAWLSVKLPAAAETLKAAFAALPAQFSAIGAAIVDGLKAGFLAKWEALKNWVGEQAKSLLDSAKSALGISSPSRAFAMVGLNITRGLQQGIQRNASGPLSQIDALAKRMTQAGAGIALGGASALAAASPLGAAPAGQAPAATGGGDTINITINAPAGTDATNLAAEVERVINRIERERAARRRSALHDID